LGRASARTLLLRDSIQIHHLLVGWCSILLSSTMLPSSIPFFVSLVEVFLLAQPNMHFRVPCQGDRRSAVTHDHQSLSWLCKYRAGISARSSTKWIKVGFGLLIIFSIFSFFSSSSCLICRYYHNIPRDKAINGESSIRYPFIFKSFEWKKSNETCDGY